MQQCICHILPPHIFKAMVRNATSAADRDRAMHNLAVSSQLTGSRTALSAMPASLAARTPGDKYRLVYNASHRLRLPGSLTRREGAIATRDPAVDEAFDGAGAVYDFLHQVFGRSSLDGRGLVLVSTTHYGRDYDNAFWDGAQMVYGDGDNRLFGRFTSAIDVIAHEFIHGLTQYTSGLVYDGESGALNESLSDMFGSMAKQRLLGQSAATADWLIGAGLLTPEVRGTALRSLKSPGTAYDDPLLGRDPQPAHLDGLVHTEEDNGGVHINSGIPNHWFYLLATALGGRSWERAGRIVYEVATRKLWADAQFRDFAQLTFDTAGELFGDGGSEQQAVRQAWQAVGLSV